MDAEASAAPGASRSGSNGAGAVESAQVRYELGGGSTPVGCARRLFTEDPFG